MKITKVTIQLLDSQMDRIILDTDLPSSVWPFEGTAQLMMFAGMDTGVEYAEKHFPDVPHKILNSRTRKAE